MPEDDLLTDAGDEVQRSALEKFGRLARLEQAAMQRDQALLADLDVRCGEGAKAVALPLLPGGASTLPQLLMISDTLMAS
jgi:hypothetical protein